jgi:C-terminal processing protease CtpA/Prc
MLRTVRTLAGSLAVVVCTAIAATAQDSETLYICVDATATRTLEIGATVCDAAPTDALTTRMEADNLQLRTGALVTDVVTGGVAQVAGLEEGDVIYRVGGVDVDSNVKVAARLSLIEESADTVVNFLRRGHPYRVKIRRP